MNQTEGAAMGGIEAIDTPAVLVDLDILERNIAAMGLLGQVARA